MIKIKKKSQSLKFTDGGVQYNNNILYHYHKPARAYLLTHILSNVSGELKVDFGNYPVFKIISPWIERKSWLIYLSRLSLIVMGFFCFWRSGTAVVQFVIFYTICCPSCNHDYRNVQILKSRQSASRRSITLNYKN